MPGIVARPTGRAASRLQPFSTQMISRVWRGWTAPDKADAYQALLLGTILPGIRARATPGYLGMRVDRREPRGAEREVEFVTTMLFASLSDVIAFAGEAYEVAVVPAAARALLSRFDAESAHYAVVGGHATGRPPALAII